MLRRVAMGKAHPMRGERAWWRWIWVGILVIIVRKAHAQQSPLVLAFTSELNARLDVKNVERCSRPPSVLTIVHLVCMRFSQLLSSSRATPDDAFPSSAAGYCSRTGFDLAVALAQDENAVPGFNLSTAYCDAGRSDIQSISCASDLVTEYGANLAGVVGLRFSSGLRGGSLFYNLHKVPVVGHASTGSEHISKEGIENVFRVRLPSLHLLPSRYHAVKPSQNPHRAHI